MYTKAQCNVNLSATVQSVSTCPQNGIIKATLSGNLGDIDMNNVSFGLESLSGGQDKPFDKNGGTIINVAPGTYLVLSRFFCKLTNSYQVVEYGPVNVEGTYPGFDHSKIIVQTANIRGSLKCIPSGMVPINLESGLPHYTVTVVNADDPDMIGRSFTKNGPGIIELEPLSAGNYTFSIEDACKYYYEIVATVPEIPLEMSISGTTSSALCENTGTIDLILKNGVAPYTVEISGDEYAGENPVVFISDGTYTLSGFGPGVYNLKIYDKCDTVNHTVPIDKNPPTFSNVQVEPSLQCIASGRIGFFLSGGKEPYQINIAGPPEYTGTQDTIVNKGAFNLNDLPSGHYKFTIVDACEDTAYLEIDIEIDQFKIDVGVTNAAECGTKGSARITITGGAPPYNFKVLVGTILSPSWVAPGTTILNNLNPGDYSIEIEDKCGKDTIHFTIGLSHPMVLDEVRKTLSCKNTGRITIIGNTYLIVEMIDSIGNVVSIIKEGNVVYYDDLPSGDFNFRIRDTCSNEMYRLIHVDSIPVTQIANPYMDNFFPPSPSDSDCQQVRILKQPDGGNTIPEDAKDIEYYWTNNSHLFFEVSWKAGNSSDWSPWEPVYNSKDTTFPSHLKYCDLRANDSVFQAKIRIKDTPPECDSVLDVIRFDVISSVLSETGKGCNGFTFTFLQNTDSKGLICYPYEWTLTKEDGTLVEGPIPQPDNSSVVRNLPLGKYYIYFKDNCGYEWKDSIRSEWRNNSVFKVSYSNYTCSTYDISFINPQVCSPYNWVLKKDKDTIAYSGGDILDVNLAQKVDKLLYDSSYFLIINQPGPQIDTINVTESIPATSHLYRIDNQGNFCLPDTAKGSISIYRVSSFPFEKGTIINYIDGPVVTTLKDTIKENTLTRYYPFAPDSSFLSLLDLPEGTYKFEIIDSCDRVYPLETYYSPPTLIDFDYKIEPDCKGARLYPKGQIRFNNADVNTYFHIIETPPGVAGFTQTVTKGGYFLIQETGTYKLRVSVDNNYAGLCTFDTLSFSFTKQTFAIDTDSTQSYICAEGTGFISIRVKGGVGPFLFQLLDGGIKVDENYIGDFNYGILGGNYDVRITDKGCGVSFLQPVEMLNLESAQLLSGTEKVCVGDTIKLNSISLGAYAVYNWAGPNGEVWDQRNWKIPHADTLNSGIYTLVVQPQGCLGPTIQTMDVEVVYPKGPAIVSPVILCLDDPEVALNAVPMPGYSVQWYAADTITPIDPPIPPTSVPDTFRYFVSQTYTALGCEGSRDPVVAIVSDRPKSVIGPYAPDICAGTNPRVIIPNTILDYTYNIYDNVGGTLMGSGRGTGDTIIIDCTIALNSDTTLTIETRNEHTCPATEYTLVDVIVVNAANELVSGNDVCVGGTIQLTSILLKTTPYFWVGPDGFISNEQNPTILDAQKTMSGIYTLSILPFGCTDSIKQLVNIDVIKPNPPKDTIIVLCQYATESALRIDPSVGNSIRWYNSLHQLLSAPPVPSTLQPDTLIYYITHLSNYLSCESDTATVTVIISALPEAVIDPYALDICAGTSPRIIIPNSVQNYTYNIYDKAGGTLMGSGRGTGDTIFIDCTITLNADAVLVVETLNEHGCVSPEYVSVSVIVVDASNTLISGNDVCVGEAIQLTSILLKTTSYFWVGPDGFISNEQNPTILDAQKTMSGIYTLSILPFGCTDSIKQLVNIDVIKPDAPDEPAPFIFCHLGPSSMLQVTPTTGNTIRWYNNLHQLLSTPPTPSTNIPDTIVYYITHVSDYLGCESDPTPVRAIISPLPDPVEKILAPDICPGIYPTINLPITIAGYRYSILSTPTDAFPLVEELSTGGGLSMLVPIELYDTTTFYVKVSNEHNCAVQYPSPIVVNVVDYLYILPDALPKYKRGRFYQQELITNGAVPYSFTTEDILPMGFTLSLSGIISGTAPRNGRIDEFPFTVHLRDADGCVKLKDYILKSETFVPEVFTPDGNDKNDVFMKGRRLVIFDRLGIKIFEGDNGWNGTRKQEPAPVDTYFYILYYEEDEDGNTIYDVEKTGYITLIRKK